LDEFTDEWYTVDENFVDVNASSRSSQHLATPMQFKKPYAFSKALAFELGLRRVKGASKRRLAD
jgi:hypothetical protein